MDKLPAEKRFYDWLGRQNPFVRLVVTVGICSACYVSWLAIHAIYDSLTASDTKASQADYSEATRSYEPGTAAENPSLTPDPTAVLNPAWRNRFSSYDDKREASGVALSAAGYPIIVVIRPTAVCSSPRRLQLAMDLQRAQRLGDIGNMPDCGVLQPQMRAEYINPNPFDNGSVEIRLHPTGALPFTAYGPDPRGGDTSFYSWFGTLNR